MRIFAMENCRQKVFKNISMIIWNSGNRLSILLYLLLLLFLCHAHSVNSHFIQIDHNEFRASGFPRPAIPPPLPPIDQLPQHLPAKELTPAEFMVDLTNDLTYRILHYHSILNRNNFAFSPTALMSVLVALYEGAAGRSAQELRNVLQFPNNKDVIRVGYRDIHRRLRTYFFGSDNPLKGLSLNKDNVTILRDYETVLMFYGYDLGMDMVSSVATTTATATTPTIEESTKPSTTTSEITTLPPDMEETTQITVAKEDAVTTTSATTTAAPATMTTTVTTTTTTEKPTTTTTAKETTTEMLTTTTVASETEAEAETTTEITAESEKDAETEAPSTAETVAEKPENEEAAELVSTFVAEEASEPFLRIEKARVTMLPSGRLQAPLKAQQKSAPMKQLPARTTATVAKPVAAFKISNQKQTTTMSPSSRTATSNAQKSSRFTNTPAPPKIQQNHQKSARLNNNPTSSSLDSNYLPATSRAFQSERISIRQARQRRHLLGSFKDNDANLFVTLFHPQAHPTPHHSLYSISGPGISPAPLTHITNEFDVEVDPHFISNGGVGSFSGATETKQNYNTDIISHIFYLGNQDVIYTTYKVYNAVLYYKYFEHLKMNVLELELDTPEYNLMILLPDYHTDLVTAAASLRLGPTLRLLRKQLKPRWVQAIIPDFKLHGSMFLTNDLQNLGICDVFEPNRADFRPMTDEKGIYVKHIEQSINVNIRTRPINQLKRNYGASQLQPIQISVNHPFLFYIIDRDLDVAVMAGRILNPLNVRIQ